MIFNRALRLGRALCVLFGTLLVSLPAQAQNEIQLKTSTEYSFQSSVYVPTGGNDLSDGSPTEVDFTCDEGATGLADQAAVNSDKVDLGVNRPSVFHLTAALEWFAAVTAGESVDFYWSPSAHATVGTGNPGEPDGVDGLYSPTGFTDDEGVTQMMYVGSHINNGNIGVQLSSVGSFVPTHRYGQLVMFNDSGTILCGTDDIESSVLMYGTVLEVQ